MRKSSKPNKVLPWLLCAMLSACAAKPSVSPLSQLPPPASLSETLSPDLQSYSQRVLDWLKRAGDTLASVGVPDKP